MKRRAPMIGKVVERMCEVGASPFGDIHVSVGLLNSLIREAKRRGSQVVIFEGGRATIFDFQYGMLYLWCQEGLRGKEFVIRKRTACMKE